MAWPFRKKKEGVESSDSFDINKPINVSNIPLPGKSATVPISSSSSSQIPSSSSSSSVNAEPQQIQNPSNALNQPVNSKVSSPSLEGAPQSVGNTSNQKNSVVNASSQTTEILDQQDPENIENPEEQTFYIDLRPKMLNLKSFNHRQEIDVRYPLMPPYAFAHIYWDDQEKEVMYKVEEPILDEAEKEVLGLIQLALEEMINVSFIRASKSNLIMQYLEGNVRSILVELGLELSDESYQKIMYVVYRDSVGLNEIEPLLNDYFIEDIECNGTDFPIFIVHRKYETLKTNIVFKDVQKATDFVEKLAQKCGRYVSYAKPLLDGTLPDGSRVNATYTPDVTTRGPTFTIRKFTKEPWTPVHLVKYKTASAETFAYMWLAIENKSNVIIVGETGSGKTTLLNALAYFIPPESRICSIEDTRELNLVHDNWLPAVTRTGFGIPNILGEQYGEITLFDLLRETFRQNPDYVILGETRGKETYVLFQGMASGHPSFSTFHAASVETLVRRLETPPINLPSSLIESIDVVLVISHSKELKGEELSSRRVQEVAEIMAVKSQLGSVEYSKAYTWDPAKDVTLKNQKQSYVLQKISRRTGIPIASLQAEVELRKKLIEKLLEKNITGFLEFSKIVNRYYKEKASVLQEFGLK